MSVVSTDLKFYLTPLGNADPEASLGGEGQGSEILELIHEIFDPVKGSEAYFGDTNYRAIDVVNLNVTDTLFEAVLYISVETTSVDDTIALAYDEGTQSVGLETTAPSLPELDFTTPLNKEYGIALGDIAPETSKRIWLRRAVMAGAAPGLSEGRLRVAGCTI